MRRSGEPALCMPVTRTHLASIVEDFRAHATGIAVVEHRGVRSYRTSYDELATLAGRFAAELVRRGIEPGDRVLLWGDNSAAWMAVFFGCLLRGVLVVPLDVTGSLAFARRVLADTAPRLVVADPGQLVLLRDVSADSGTAFLAVPDLAGQLPPEPDFRVDPSVGPDTPFQIIFTSGTTSEPKGIVHTHRNVLASLLPIETEIDRYRRYERLVHPLRFLQTLPLSHVFGQFMGLWIPGILGAELHFSDALDAGRVVSLLRRERISVLIAVPRVLSLLRGFLLAERPTLARELDAAASVPVLKRWWRFRATHRRLGWKFWAVISGGASLPRELEEFWQRLGFALVQGYGMTETAALITLNHPFRIDHGTIGKALPGREMRLSDTGELLVRGEMVSSATWQSGRIVPRENDWLATGDLVEQNDTGAYRFVGRKGDAIVTSSGLNIHPVDLETAMLRQPGVQGCAVVSCDGVNGPEPVCVVLSQEDNSTLQRAVRAANAELADSQQMRRVLRWPEIAFPYTATGKLLRRSIREWACRAIASENGTGGVADTSGDLLLQAVASVTGRAVPHPGSSSLRLSEDLHLDSLGRVQLASAIEQQTGVLLTDESMAEVATLGELRQAIASSLARATFGGSVAPPAAGASTLTSDEPLPVQPEHMQFPASADQLQQGRAGSADFDQSQRRSHESFGAVASASVYPHWPWSMPFRWLRRCFLELALRPLVTTLLAPRVSVEAPVPTGPLLLVANHVTMLDAGLILFALPVSLRGRIAVMMSGEMLTGFRSGRRAGIAGRAAYVLLTALFNVFPLPQLQGFRQSFAHAGEALDHGMSVLIFPEGARSRTGAMAPFRSGIGLLASQAGVPVLPVALLGLHQIRAKGERWFRSGALRIQIGAALEWDAARSPEAWTALLEAKLKELLHETP